MQPRFEVRYGWHEVRTGVGARCDGAVIVPVRGRILPLDGLRSDARNLRARCEDGLRHVGNPVVWQSGCVDLYVQEDGAPSQGIDWKTTEASVQRAVDTWLGADCGGQPPSLTVNVVGSIHCHTWQYNSQAHNANIVMFRRRLAVRGRCPDSIGLTHSSFERDGDGSIWDSDIELNAFQFTFSVDGTAPGDDLDSVLTHEVGHWFGLDHSKDPNATMFAEYGGGTGFRTLSADDERGICAIYPPGRTPTTQSCEPRHGFSGFYASTSSRRIHRWRWSRHRRAAGARFLRARRQQRRWRCWWPRCSASGARERGLVSGFVETDQQRIAMLSTNGRFDQLAVGGERLRALAPRLPDPELFAPSAPRVYDWPDVLNSFFSGTPLLSARCSSAFLGGRP